MTSKHNMNGRASVITNVHGQRATRRRENRTRSLRPPTICHSRHVAGRIHLASFSLGRYPLLRITTLSRSELSSRQITALDPATTRLCHRSGIRRIALNLRLSCQLSSTRLLTLSTSTRRPPTRAQGRRPLPLPPRRQTFLSLTVLTLPSSSCLVVQVLVRRSR
jgi:hypothetical protein